MSLVNFIKSKTFGIHILLALAAGIVVLWFSLKALDMYTRHGRTISVPELDGIEKDEALRILDRSNLRAVINDSIFDSAREKGTVASQNPAAGIDVKRNRTVYLTTVAILPEMVSMPELTDLSLRQALAMLQAYGLEAGRLEYVPNIARNAVLQQKYNQGTIEPGTTIEKGTKIDLVLGDGMSDNRVNVPLLIGRTRREAIQLINSASLNLGQEVFLDEDQEDVKVYRQSPAVHNTPQRLAMGSTIDLYYRSIHEFDFEEYMEETLSAETPDLTGKSPEEAFQILRDAFMVMGNETFENNVPANRARVFRQEPDPIDNPTVTRGTTFNIWYRDIDDFDRD